MEFGVKKVKKVFVKDYNYESFIVFCGQMKIIVRAMIDTDLPSDCAVEKKPIKPVVFSFGVQYINCNSA